MALSKALFGLRRARKRGSNANSTGYSTYNINPAGYATDIFTGDPVLLSGGYIAKVSVTINNVVGVFMGCTYVDQATGTPRWRPYYPAGTSVGTDAYGIKAFVDDDHDATYLIQSDASVSAGHVGSRFHVTLGAGVTAFGQSGVGLLAASVSTQAAAFMLEVVGLYEVPGNAWSDPNPVVEVRINRHVDNMVAIGATPSLA